MLNCNQTMANPRRARTKKKAGLAALHLQNNRGQGAGSAGAGRFGVRMPANEI